MILYQNSRKIIVSTILTMVMLSPMMVQFLLIFEDHHHIPCQEEQTTHIHEAATDCFVCDVRLVTFDYAINKIPEFSKILISTTVKEHYTSVLYKSFNNANIQLRGPPHILI